MAATQPCSNPTQSKNPQAASALGDVGCTTVASSAFAYTHEGTETKGDTLATNRHIYGPFEAGFTSKQKSIIQNWGCSNPSDVYDTEGGTDIATAQNKVAAICGVSLPRVEGDEYFGVVGDCGGHTPDYHFHGSFSCLYKVEGTHSTKVGVVGNGNIYGEWEDYSQKRLPLLDACGGHFGTTPESSTSVYHYHVKRDAPFTIGCYGPNASGGLVTVEQCRALYSACSSSESMTVAGKTIQYSRFCPCFDAKGLNTGTINELPAINSTVNYYSSDSWSCRNDYTCIKDVCTSNCLTGSTSAAAAAKAGPLTSLLALFVLVKAICFA